MHRENKVLSSQSQEECMFTFSSVSRIIFVVKVEDKFFWFKTKLLIQQHSGVGGGDVQSDVFPHTSLKTINKINSFMLSMLGKNFSR